MALKRDRSPMPAFVHDALTGEALMTAYDARPDYRKNDYLGWITRAKLKATRRKRLAQMIDE